MATPTAAPYRARQHHDGISHMIPPSFTSTVRGSVVSTREGGALRHVSSLELEHLREEWRELVLHSPSPHLQDLPEWILPALRTANTRSCFSAIVSRHAGKLIGVLPIVQRSNFLGAIPTHVIRGFTSDLSPRCDLIHHHAYAKLAAQMSWEALREDHRWRVVELPHVPEGGAADTLADYARNEGFRVETISTTSTPIINLTRGSLSYLPAEARVYRDRLETRLRNVRHFGDIQLRSYTSMEEPLHLLMALEKNSRRGGRAPALRAPPEHAAIYTEIGRWAARCGALRVFSLEINGEPLSMLYGITVQDTYYALRVAHDTRLAMYSPGQLVVMAALQELQRQGTRECELVGPVRPWKMVWTSATRKHRSHYIFRPDRRGRTPLASLFTLTDRARSAWQHMLKRRCFS